MRDGAGYSDKEMKDWSPSSGVAQLKVVEQSHSYETAKYQQFN